MCQKWKLAEWPVVPKLGKQSSLKFLRIFMFVPEKKGKFVDHIESSITCEFLKIACRMVTNQNIQLYMYSHGQS